MGILRNRARSPLPSGVGRAVSHISYNPFSLDGKRILVTGASSGIGRQIAISFSKMGANVVLSGRNHERLSQTLAAMSEGNHMVIPADIVDNDQRCRLADEAGALHGMVHCAGTSVLSPIRLASQKHLRDLYVLNYESPILLTQRLLYRKAVQSSGSILFIASIAAHIGVPGVGAYSGTKAALLATVRCLAMELVKHRIRVNCLSPSLVASPLLDLMAQSVSLEEKSRDHPLGLGTPEDIANAAIYFVSDASRWVTGTTLIMDGGLTIS
jgi:NAD(P)-dependent dehydrogenase (short-subunit alcohol dehydrogenase family)